MIYLILLLISSPLIAYDARYVHPEKIFSADIPDWLIHPFFDEIHTPNSNQYAVIMDDDFGNMARFDVIIHPEEEMKEINTIMLTSSYKHVLESLFNNLVLDTVTKNFPGTEILDSRFTALEGGDLGFLIQLSIPKGSTLQNPATGQKLDSKRTYLLSMMGNQTVILSTQESLLTRSARASEMKKYGAIKQDSPPYDLLLELKKSYNCMRPTY